MAAAASILTAIVGLDACVLTSRTQATPTWTPRRGLSAQPLGSQFRTATMTRQVQSGRKCTDDGWRLQIGVTWCVISWYRSSGSTPSVMSRSNVSSQDLGFLPSARARRTLQYEYRCRYNQAALLRNKTPAIPAACTAGPEVCRTEHNVQP